MREEMINKARDWLGTPFKHQGRVKNHGCDCLGFIIGVGKELDIKPRGKSLSEIDEINYSQIPDSDKLQQKLSEYLKQVALAKINKGQIALLKFQGEPRHLGIIANHQSSKMLSIIHAYQPAGKVVEHILDNKWQRRITALYEVENYK